MKFFPCGIIVLVIAGIATACKKDNNSVSGTDKDFLLQAAYANAAEISAGNLAVSGGMRDSIRIFGALMVTDHHVLQQTVDSLAKQAGIQVPNDPDSTHQAFAQKLQTFSGYQFDTTYIHGQVKDHQNSIRLYQNEVVNGNNVQIKKLAGDKLVMLQQHYNTALSISQTE